MAKSPLEVEFAFGMPSGAVVFVTAGHVLEALAKVADLPKAWSDDRKPVVAGVTQRPSTLDEIYIGVEHLIWWTTLGGDTSMTFEGCEYPGLGWLPSARWLGITGNWKWGVTPKFHPAPVPKAVVDTLTKPQKKQRRTK